MSASANEAEVIRLTKLLAKAQATSLKWAERRHKMPMGSSRARVTTANAEWARAAEHRDRISDQLDQACARVAAEQATTASP